MPVSHVIFVYAEESIRFNRLLRRNEEKDPKDFKEFLVQMENEKKIFDIEKLEKQYNLKIDCNMPFGEMKDSVESIINRFYFLHEEPLMLKCAF